MYRLFVAIKLPEDISEDLLKLGAGVRNARWLEPDQLHLTLCYIGEVDGLDFQDIVLALSEINKEAFELSLKGVGYWGTKAEPRSLWAGVEKSTPLEELKAKVMNLLRQKGIDIRKKKFVPHITFAKLRGTEYPDVGRFLQFNSLYRSRTYRVESFELYTSVLKPSGASYEIEASYPLDTAG